MRNLIILIYFINFFILYSIYFSDAYFVTDAIGNRIEYSCILFLILLFFLVTMISFFLIKRYHHFFSNYKLLLFCLFLFIVIFIFLCLMFIFLKIYYFELYYKWNDKIILFKSIDNTYFLNKIYTEKEKFVFSQLYWEHINNTISCHYILNDTNIEICINKNSLSEIKEYLNVVYKQRLDILLNESPHWGIKMHKKEILYYGWRIYYHAFISNFFFNFFFLSFIKYKSSTV